MLFRSEVVQGSISEDGVCKLWVIPENKMSDKRSAAVAAEEAAVESPAAETEHSRSDDEALAAKVKLAELNAVLLRTHLQTSSAAQ